ncbi:MAG: stage II sporulation protein R [Clostridiaceae bacterium]|jgi:stage II sporulation protein R|nr:stage II sporulation protein R [Clostridiaceae bacterium]
MDKIFKRLRKISFGNFSRRAKLIAGILAIAAIFIFIRLITYTESVNTSLSDSVIRLHVIANSDAPMDQDLKHTVRDAVLEYVRNKVQHSESVDQTRALVLDDISGITAVAKQAVADSGKSYDVKVHLGRYPFPTKAYGDILLPAGDYQALRIVIGNGDGANWWCVLFPPLCFVDVTHGTVPEEIKDDLKKVLTEEEYQLVTSSDDETDIPIKIKFKIVEVFQDSKLKIAGAFEKLLGGSKS